MIQDHRDLKKGSVTNRPDVLMKGPRYQLNLSVEVVFSASV
jgi:hypothetical protein